MVREEFQSDIILRKRLNDEELWTEIVTMRVEYRLLYNLIIDEISAFEVLKEIGEEQKNKTTIR